MFEVYIVVRYVSVEKKNGSRTDIDLCLKISASHAFIRLHILCNISFSYNKNRSNSNIKMDLKLHETIQIDKVLLL